MNEFAAQGSGIEATRQLIGKTGEHALAHIRAFDAALSDIEPLLLGDLEKLLEERPHLPRSLRVYSESSAGLDRIVGLIGETPRAHRQEKIALVLLA